MRLAHVQFSKAAPDAAAQYYDEPHLRAWARAVVGDADCLSFHCRVLGNATDDKGSGARLAHQFAEHVVCASSNPPPAMATPRGPAPGRASGPLRAADEAM